MPVFIPSWRKSLMITLNSRKRDCSHISILDYTSSTVILLWNQSRFPASSVRYKPDIRHLLMLRKMCLTSLQSDFVWFCCVDLNSIWVGKPVAGNKVTLSSSLDGDGWGFFSMVGNYGSFVWRTLKAIGFLSCFWNVGVSCDEVKCKIYTTSSQNFLTSLLIINSIHLEKRSACQWAKSFRRQYSSLSVQKGCPEATDGNEPRDEWLSDIREGLLAQVRL